MEKRIKEIQASHALSKLAPQTFSAKVQRRLASTAPPRPIIDIGFDEAFKYLAKMFDDVQRALRATHLSPVQGLGPIIVRVFPASSCRTNAGLHSDALAGLSLDRQFQ